MEAKELLSLLQGIYFVFMGVWPLIHIRSFLAVTGPKTDIWLVKTVSFLILAIGSGLLLAYYQQDISLSTVLVAVLSALFLGFVDVYYSLRNVISKIYLLDAGIEVLIIGAWVAILI